MAILTAESSSGKGGKTAKEMWHFALRTIFVYTSKGTLTGLEILRPTALLPLWERARLYRPRSGLNPWTLSPIASSLTTRSPKTIQILETPVLFMHCSIEKSYLEIPLIFIFFLMKTVMRWNFNRFLCLYPFVSDLFLHMP